MRINFLVNLVGNGWEPTDTRLGGTEESVVRWAQELSNLGHSVIVYKNGRGNPATNRLNDVVYRPREEYAADRYPNSVCINIKSSDVSPKEPTFYLTNETNASDLDLSAYKGVIWPSKWAVDNIPVNNKTFILPHGYDPDQIYPGKKIPKQCFYASSPDRGLDTLLEAWPETHRAHPDATLLLTYGAPEVNLPGVINLGEVDEDTMNDIYRTSDIWCHPANGGELYCMSGIKAQVAGCIPVVIPAMALGETVRHGYKTNKENYARTLIKALDTDNIGIREALAEEHYPTWQDSATLLSEIIGNTHGR